MISNKDDISVVLHIVLNDFGDVERQNDFETLNWWGQVGIVF